MPSASMFFRTEMIFWRDEAEVFDRGHYTLIRTPSNPTYYDGNVLVFEHPPAEGDYTRWVKLFEEEFKDRPEVRHVHFMWDVREGETSCVAPFVDNDFVVRSNMTLLADSINPPPKINHEIEVRTIETDEEWEMILDAKVRMRDPVFELEPYTEFKRRWLDSRRSLTARGQGNWYGAFIKDRLVADLGLFRDGRVARFQDVGTESEFRRRGICGTLVYEVSKKALATEGVETLVMVADENYHAARIYESVGFRPKERNASACRYPQEK